MAKIKLIKSVWSTEYHVVWDDLLCTNQCEWGAGGANLEGAYRA